MIAETIMTVVFGIGKFILSLIPGIELGASFTGLFDDVSFLLSFATYFLPVGTILACLSAIFVVDNIKFIISIFNWIISKIPTIS